MGAASAALTPEAFLQLAGHPLRWRLLGDLARSDRTVQELTGLVGPAPEPGLLPPGQAPRRPPGLGPAQLGRPPRRLLHRRPHPPRRAARRPPARPCTPGSVSSRRPDRPAGPARATARVLFLCTGNSARSQMAEALARARSGGPVEAHSAGSHPKPLHPNAVRVMRDEHGIDLAGHRSEAPERVRRAAVRPGDQPVRPGARGLPRVPRRPRDHPLEHPRPRRRAPDGDDEASYPAFQQTAAELDTRIGFLLAALADPSRPAQEDP